MANTYTLINSVTVGSGGLSAIAFTSIPNTYTDLLIKISAKGATNQEAGDLLLTLNGSTSNFTNTRLFSYQTTVYSDNQSNFVGQIPGSNVTANSFGSAEIYIPNYAGSANKTISGDSGVETNSANGLEYIGATLWSNTAAITSISLSNNAGNFVEFSTAYLYGISKS